MNTMQIIHKLHELAELTKTDQTHKHFRKVLFDEQVREIANELMTVSTELGYMAHRNDTFDQLFEKYLRIRSIDVLRGICLKMGVEI